MTANFEVCFAVFGDVRICSSCRVRRRKLRADFVVSPETHFKVIVLRKCIELSFQKKTQSVLFATLQNPAGKNYGFHCRNIFTQKNLPRALTAKQNCAALES